MKTVTVDRDKIRKLLGLLDHSNECPCIYCPHQDRSCIGSRLCGDMAYEALVVPKQLELFDNKQEQC